MSSSAFMIYVGLGLKLKYRLSEHWEIGVSAGAKHYSNGKYGIWNKGMNNLGGDVSLRTANTLFRAMPWFGSRAVMVAV